MKILLVTEYYPPEIYGGGEIGAKVLAESLAKKGNAVTVLTSKVPNMPDETQEKGITVIRTLETGNPLSVIGNITRRMVFKKSVKKQLPALDDKENFDTIHFLNNTSIIDLGEKNSKTVATINSYVNLCPKANLFYKEKGPCTGCAPGKYVGCMLRSKYVGKVRLPFFLKYNPLFWLVHYRSHCKRVELMKKVKKKIAISSYIMNMLKTYNIPGGRFVPNFTVIKEKLLPKKKENKKLVVTYIGALEKMKGVMHFLKAYLILHGKGQDKDVEFRFVGSGNLALFIKKIAEKETNNVVFNGPVAHENIHTVYAKSDVIVIPSLWPEPFSRVLLEAFYHGKPVIATNSGGNKDQIQDGKTGFLVDPSEPAEDIAEAVVKLKDQGIRKKMGKQAQAFYAANLTPDKTLVKIMDVYNG